MAMPATEPGPDGTCSAYPAQPLPTRSAAGSAAALVEGEAEAVVAAALDEVVLSLLLEASVEEPLEHAATPKIATALRPAAAILR
jgi:hypothetical protein